MRNIILFSIIILTIGCFSASKKAVKTEVTNPVVVPESYVTRATPPNTLIGVLPGIEYNNTRIRIHLDSLISGVTVDTTIVRLNANTITTYTFTPQINFWGKTDTSYNARYFLTIDVRQEITPGLKESLKKRVAEMDKEIEDKNAEMQRKIKARNDALQLSKN